MIQIIKLNKKINRKQVLNDINIRINDGIHGFIGPHGAGKSTLLKIISTLLNSDSGKIVFEKEITDKQKMRNIISFVPNQFNLYPKLTVLESLYFISKLRNSRNDHHNNINRLLTMSGLIEYKDNRLSDLSAGVIKRIGIVQALLNNPHYLIIDEPTTGLDQEDRISIRNFLRMVSKDVNIILASHEVEDITQLCKEVTMLLKGSVLFNDTLDNFLILSQSQCKQGFHESYQFLLNREKASK